MPRRLRSHYYGAMYHVMLRGNHKNRIFFNDDHYTFFYSLLQSVFIKYSCKIHLFCLMTNHVHLVIEVGHIPLKKIMQSLASRYASRINKFLNLQGHLFQGRYKEKPIMDEAYLLELFFYIHNNPLAAGMVADVDQYPWSSYRAYTDQEHIPWLETKFIREILAKHSKEGQDVYRGFMLNKLENVETPKHCVLNESGELDIAGRIKKKVMSNTPLSFGHLKFEEFAKIISNHLHVSYEKMCSASKKRAVTEARCLLAYFAHYRGQHTLRDIALFLNRNPDSLSRTINRYLSKRHNPDSELDAKIAMLELALSQITGNDPTI